jgi:hypothetical protein
MLCKSCLPRDTRHIYCSDLELNVADGVVPFRMERVAGDVERLHFGSADLDAVRAEK